MTTRYLEIRQGVLSKNDALAGILRSRYRAAGVLTLNIVSSPGSGKTAFLERLMGDMRQAGHTVAALVGDLQTDNDAKRLARSGAPVRQIVTDGVCHLEADMIESHLAAWNLDLNALQYFFVENVGNLVCPTWYDLGEAMRVVLLSVTEGEDKPLKYPSMFFSADVAVITKIDLAQACEFDRNLAHQNILAVNPNIPIFETSAKTGDGMEAFRAFLVKTRADSVEHSE